MGSEEREADAARRDSDANTTTLLRIKHGLPNPSTSKSNITIPWQMAQNLTAAPRRAKKGTTVGATTRGGGTRTARRRRPSLADPGRAAPAAAPRDAARDGGARRGWQRCMGCPSRRYPLEGPEQELPECRRRVRGEAGLEAGRGGVGVRGWRERTQESSTGFNEKFGSVKKLCTFFLASTRRHRIRHKSADCGEGFKLQPFLTRSN